VPLLLGSVVKKEHNELVTILSCVKSQLWQNAVYVAVMNMDSKIIFFIGLVY
jgi:hypothetical protein